MKKNKIIKVLLILIGLVLIFCMAFLLTDFFKDDNKINEKKEETSIKANTNEDIIKEQEVEGNVMRNTSLIVEDGITYLVVDVTNNTNLDYRLNEYVIVVKDINGNEIIRIPGYVGELIGIGETKTIRSMVNMDLSDAASIEYEVVK